MPPDAIFGLVITAILAVVIGIALASDEAARANRVAVGIYELGAQLKLDDCDSWIVTMRRRSGYDHGVWTISGSRGNALNLAISKLRQARIETVCILANDPRKFEVEAFFESNGARRTGKYIGGFVIQPNTN